MSESSAFAKTWIREFRDVLDGSPLIERLEKALELVRAVKERDAKLLFAGNGASATIASHYALDFTKQGKVRSMCFNDAALLTAYTNDYGQTDWVTRALEHHAREGDLAVLISTSGSSPNIVNAAKWCQSASIPVLAFSGFNAHNPLHANATVGFWADSRAYNIVESVHSAWLGLLCDLLIGAKEYGVKG